MSNYHHRGGCLSRKLSWTQEIRSFRHIFMTTTRRIWTEKSRVFHKKRGKLIEFRQITKRMDDDLGLSLWKILLSDNQWVKYRRKIFSSAILALTLI